MILQQLGDVRMNPVTLAFPGEFEQNFQTNILDRSLNHTRLALLLGAFIYGIYGILDGQLDATACSGAWFIRYRIVCPAILAVIMLTFSNSLRHIHQESMAILVSLCGVGIIFMMNLSAVYEDLYFPGILVVIAYGSSFCRLRFIHSSMAMIVIIAAYEYFEVFKKHHTSAVYWNNNFHIIILVIIGMFSSYQLERYARRDYLQKLIIAEERRKGEEFKLAQEKERIINNLHDGIGGIITNINFISEMDHSEADRKEKALCAISELSGECLNEIRTFINVHAEKEKSWRTMLAEMRHFGCTMLESHAITLEFSAEGELDAHIPNSLTTINLMRIYRELLANIVKHAGADGVTVKIMVTDNRLEMIVSDNGVWQKRDTGYEGRGMANMAARAVEMSGTFVVDTTTGTQVRLSIPLEAS